MSTAERALSFDLKSVSTGNKIAGFWQMLSGFRIAYVIANLALGLAAIAKTSTYLLLRYFVDHVLLQPNPVIPVGWIAAGFIGLAAIEGGFTFLSGRLAARTAEGVIQRLRNYLFDHIQQLPYSYHKNTDTGELVQRATSDVDNIRRFLSEQAIGVGRIVLLFAVNFAALMTLNVRLALLSIVVIPVVVIVSILFFRKVSKAYEAYQEQDAALTTTLQENLSGVRIVKAFARQGFEIEKFDRENLEKYRRGRILLTIHSIFWPVSDILCGLQMTGGFLAAAIMAIQGQISVGSYLAYVGLVVWIIFPMRNLGRLIVQASSGFVSLSRVMEIIKENRESLDKGDPLTIHDVQGKIEFRKVYFEYEKGTPALEDISFTCEPGQVIALLGSTGSGKTTLVNLLPRFYDPTRGQVLLDGIDLRMYPKRWLRQQIGIVEQEPFLFSRSIRENITYGTDKETSKTEVETAARAAAIHHVINEFKDGYDTLVGERGVTLSGGQKQRVAIARTLLKNPRILILDDSTSSVDLETEAEIREALQNLMKERTTFIIAHRVQGIMDADLILVMDEGRIVQKGRHEQLMQEEGFYSRIFEIQTRLDEELKKEIDRGG